MFKGGIQATRDAAAALALMLKPGMVVSLVGELGAGKTTLVAALAAALQSDHPVSSPTFTVIHEVQTPTLMLCHIDAYRCSARDVLNLGLDDYQQDGFVLLVEFAHFGDFACKTKRSHVTGRTAIGRDHAIGRLLLLSHPHQPKLDSHLVLLSPSPGTAAPDLPFPGPRERL